GVGAGRARDPCAQAIAVLVDLTVAVVVDPVPADFRSAGIGGRPVWHARAAAMATTRRDDDDDKLSHAPPKCERRATNWHVRANVSAVANVVGAPCQRCQNRLPNSRRAPRSSARNVPSLYGYHHTSGDIATRS